MEHLMLKMVKTYIYLGCVSLYDVCIMNVIGKLGWKWCWMEKYENVMKYTEYWSNNESYNDLITCC